MGCNHITNFSTLDAICKALDCQLGDILETQSYKAEPFKRWRTVAMQRETQLCIVDKAGMLLCAPMRVCCTAQSHRCITFLYYFCVPV